MTSPSAALARAFLARWRGDARTDASDPLEALLAERAASGRAAWPGVALEALDFAAWLGERAAGGDDPVASAAALRSDDLFLACACARGDRTAQRALDRLLRGHLPVFLASLRLTDELAAAAAQDLLSKLLVAEGPAAPKIAQYGGVGPLAGWLRVAAIRTALNLLESDGRRAARSAGEEPLGAIIVPGVDLELDFIRAHHREDFGAAFREAFAALPPRDRNLLRFAFVDGLTPGKIGALHGVHRTTAMRWIQAAERELLAGLRARLSARLGASETECEGLVAALQSRLSLSLRTDTDP